MKIEQLGKPIKIGNKTAPNRIVYQPTESNNCDDQGRPTQHTFDKYTAVARGRPGIIHVESIDVTRKTQARSNRMPIMEENLPGLKKLVAEIRKINDQSLIVFQLSHAGRLSEPAFKPAHTVYDTGDPKVRVMGTQEIVDTREEFVASAVRAHRAGADGVDFKQAHGFIGDDFLRRDPDSHRLYRVREVLRPRADRWLGETIAAPGCRRRGRLDARSCRSAADALGCLRLRRALRRPAAKPRSREVFVSWVHLLWIGGPGVIDSGQDRQIPSSGPERVFVQCGLPAIVT